jgi:hypothetical protein
VKWKQQRIQIEEIDFISIKRNNINTIKDMRLHSYPSNYINAAKYKF